MRDAEKARARARRWRISHLESCRVKQRNYYRRNPVIYLLNACRARAKAKGIPFNLNKADIAIPECCPVLGIPLTHGTRGFHENSPSIDQIIPGKGYVPGNVVVISFRANRIKHDATLDELRKLVRFLEERSSISAAPLKSTT